jgi:hypothetical protein
MSNENIVYNPYYGTNLCNLLANSIVEKIKSIDPNLYVNISVTNVDNFLMTCGETEYKERLNITELFTEVMDSIPEPMRTLVKVFDLINYGSERKKETIFYKERFSKYRKNLMEDYNDVKILKTLNNSDVYCNLQHFNDKTYLQVLSNEHSIELPSGFELMEKTNKVFISEDIFGKDIYSIKYLYILSRYIAYTLFQSNLCGAFEISIQSDSEIKDISHETISLKIDSESLIVTKKWVESLVLDIFDFEIDKVVGGLQLENYDFKNEILNVGDDYIWMKRDRLKDIVLV